MLPKYYASHSYYIAEKGVIIPQSAKRTYMLFFLFTVISGCVFPF